MSNQAYRPPHDRNEFALSITQGGAFAIALFFLMALAQMTGEVSPPKNTIDDMAVAYVPPVIEELEEEPPPPELEKEPPPELEVEPPQLSLDQLDIALNPGTGGSLAGDFAMPTIRTSGGALGTEDFVDFSDLDEMPRPVGVSGFDFPRRLRSKPASGRIVLLIKLDETGSVLEAQIDSSDLPNFDDFIVSEVSGWKFTPPTQNGHPVRAQARLPIPINIR